MFNPLIQNWPWFAALFILWIFLKTLSSASIKGWMGEKTVTRGLSQLDPSLYRSFHDFYLPRPDGMGTTQIDHAIVSPYGIFVIETKNYKGWIFGSEKQRQWTQQIYRNKNRFQNPLHQNQLHIRAMMKFLALPEDHFHSLVFFVGGAEFKTPMPGNVLNHGLLSWIKMHSIQRIDSQTASRIITQLTDHTQTSDRKTLAKQHLRDRQKAKA